MKFSTVSITQGDDFVWFTKTYLLKPTPNGIEWPQSSMSVTFFQLWVSITLASQNESTDNSFAITVIKEPSITKNIETI